jgi:hypothetical protein
MVLPSITLTANKHEKQRTILVASNLAEDHLLKRERFASTVRTSKRREIVSKKRDTTIVR